jgi:hypothetical protein
VVAEGNPARQHNQEITMAIGFTIPADLYKNRELYGYSIHGDDATGATDIEFRNIGDANHFIAETGLVAHAIIRDAVTSFTAPVVLTITVGVAYTRQPALMDRIRQMAADAGLQVEPHPPVWPNYIDNPR